jgi:hypothetical protein
LPEAKMQSFHIQGTAPRITGISSMNSGKKEVIATLTHGDVIGTFALLSISKKVWKLRSALISHLLGFGKRCI